MPLDSQATPSTESLLTAPQRESLKAALSSVRAGQEPMASQRSAVHEISERAALVRRTPEQSLVAFKSLLNEVANESGIPLGRDRANLLERFVSLFIEEFYATAWKSAGADGDSREKIVNRPIRAEIRDIPGAPR